MENCRVQARSHSLALCSGWALLALGVPSCCVKAAGTCWGPAVGHLWPGDLVPRARQMEGAQPSPVHEAALRQSWPTWLMGLAGDKQLSMLLSKRILSVVFVPCLNMCLVLKWKFFKGRRRKAAVPVCSNANRAAEGWLTGLHFW